MYKVEEEFDKEFEVGKSYTNVYLKEKVREIYRRIDYRASPKANDLGNYFETKDCLMSENGKRVHGLKLLSKKT